MKTSHVVVSVLALGAAAMAGGAGAQTQDSTMSSAGSPWYGKPAPYIGFNAGRSSYRQGCGTGLLSCDNRDNAYSVYAGSMLSNHFGLELGYIDMGDIARAGGKTGAYGFNLSLVGRVPLGERVGLFGKLGTTYGRTSVSSASGSGVASGNDSGFGLSVGAGVSYDLTQNWSAMLQWERHDFKFPGTGRDNINATTIGLKYRF